MVSNVHLYSVNMFVDFKLFTGYGYLFYMINM